MPGDIAGWARVPADQIVDVKIRDRFARKPAGVQKRHGIALSDPGGRCSAPASAAVRRVRR
ncbi:MAG TPA: hypothetical protein VHA71_05365, partial [Rhodanobacteraceae bacterium]|nr:hypothetical protein [Rhodanobacteraceae bacterium]